MTRDMKAYAVTIVAGLAGAALATLAGIPAGALIGSTVAVVAVAATGLRVGLPTVMRDLAFATIGVSLGSGIDERVFDHLEIWAVSLAILVASLTATIWMGRLVLTRGFGLDAKTATLASSPGTMSNAIAIAVDGHGDPTAVMFLQLMRLLILVVSVPPLALALGGSTVAAGGGVEAMSAAVCAVLLALSLGLGRLGTAAGVPAATLLAGMVVSAAGHATGLVHGIAPSWGLFAAFATTGAVLSTRMSRVTASQLKHHLLAGCAVVASAIVLSLGFALIAPLATGLPFTQIWIAYAPGGVEAMAAIGLSLGYDPAYVAVHHFARILILILIVPIVLRF
ncbi:AbrB family transcriptional regulator [Roseisalinus antarcticus]|uniref:Putative ammonia monooxygenase n=1 Tax=Roseisalinus antarcticus TaxID=254357 RepID=A0A1Y5U2V9_9RHOB|nr:AbrB family transcriptional regulator [Roseisalinus antarcticus]SLN75536.1 Putative ammonia monooxygenase [Roseisalinus antarcticus]